MIEIRFHGRGGQGAVVASKILAVAFFLENKYVQSFPAFGVERRGAPVTAFLRVSEEPINLRCEIYEPNHLIVLDPTLVLTQPITKGLKEGGWILINSVHHPSEFKLGKEYKVATVPANDIAVKHRLGSKATPIVNTAILGAFSKISGLVTIDNLSKAVYENVPVAKKANVDATLEAYNSVVF